jgi:hypothetical protein
VGEPWTVCRPDDRGDVVVVQIAPPLICGQAEFDEIEQVRRHTLTEAHGVVWERAPSSPPLAGSERDPGRGQDDRAGGTAPAP